MILAIDPGSVKTGVALVHEDGELKEKRIIPTQSLLQYVQGLVTKAWGISLSHGSAKGMTK